MTSLWMSTRIIPLPNCDFQLVAIPWNWFQIIFKMEWTKIWSTVLFPRSNNSILGRFWVKTENHERNISRKCPKKSKNGQKWWIRINLRFINFRMDDCGRKLYDSKNSENRLESAFHYTRKWIEKEKFVKSFGIMRDQKVRRIMGNYGEPSGNICSDLLIEPQVTSLGHDLKWPHDEHRHILPTVPGLTTTKTGPNARPSWTISDWTSSNPFYHRRPTFVLYLNYYRLLQPR